MSISFAFCDTILFTQALFITSQMYESDITLQVIYRAFSHDVTAAILVFQNNETAAKLVFQTNPLGVELFSFVKTFFCSKKFAWLLAT